MWRPPLWRTLATAPSSQAPLRAASRRASPLRSGAVADNEHRGRKATLRSEYPRFNNFDLGPRYRTVPPAHKLVAVASWRAITVKTSPLVTLVRDEALC